MEYATVILVFWALCLYVVGRVLSQWISRPIVIPVVFALFGLLFAPLASAGMFANWSPADVQEFTFPLPHHIPKSPGNLTLRFAMVHDVIHERFPVHGKEYYRARNREAEQALKPLNTDKRGKEVEEYFRLTDDLAVGLEFLSEHQAAIDLMGIKLAKQEALSYEGRDLYSTYANLGTFLILWQLNEGVGDVPKAKQRIAESIDWIHKAVKVLPESHFGREQWQVVLEEFLLAALDKPQLLLRYDMIGNRLDFSFAPNDAKCFDEKEWLENPRHSLTFGFNPMARRAADYLKDPKADRDTKQFRDLITTVGAEASWTDSVKTEHKRPVAFDEPALGIVGMWRMGSGANPHFALSLGEIMLRVGQRYIAWTAFERAYRMKEHFWPDANIQERFGKHCRARQNLIEKSQPGVNWQSVLAKFDGELALGKKYQNDYMDHEAQQIAAGKRTDDPAFYDDFHKSHDAIATPVGDEDKSFGKYSQSSRSSFPVSLFFAGLFALIAASVMWLRQRLSPAAPH